MLALHLTVADQIKGRRQAGQACANDISGLLVHVLGLFGMGERFVSSSRVIHHENLLICVDVFIIFSPAELTISRKYPVIRILSRGSKV